MASSSAIGSSITHYGAMSTNKCTHSLLKSVPITGDLFLNILRDFLDEQAIIQCGRVNQEWNNYIRIVDEFLLRQQLPSSYAQKTFIKIEDHVTSTSPSVNEITAPGTSVIRSLMTRFLDHVEIGTQGNTFHCFFEQNKSCFISIELGTGMGADSKMLFPKPPDKKMIYLFKGKLPKASIVEASQIHETPTAYHRFQVVLPAGTSILWQFDEIHEEISIRRRNLEKNLQTCNTVMMQIILVAMLAIIVFNQYLSRT